MLEDSGRTGADGRLAWTDPRAWIVVALAVVFLALGGFFIAVPVRAAILFGLPAPENEGLAYIRAIGFRDVALGLYLLGLLLWSSRGAVRVVIGASIVIPVCDVVLVTLVTHGAAIWQIAVHAAAGLCLAGVWFSLRRP